MHLKSIYDITLAYKLKVCDFHSKSCTPIMINDFVAGLKKLGATR